MIQVALLGFLLGLFVAFIGAWKDSAWESFQWMTFWRSPILTCLAATVLATTMPNQSVILLVLAAGMIERLLVETWKGVLRRKPSKFSHPDRDTQWLRVNITTLAKRKITWVVITGLAYSWLYGFLEFRQFTHDGLTAAVWAELLYYWWIGAIGLVLGIIGLGLGLVWCSRSVTGFSALVTMLAVYPFVLSLFVLRQFGIPIAATTSLTWPITH